ncbi:hypothetical protein GCM10020219_011120 [Nonomuraea dietziae]
MPVEEPAQHIEMGETAVVLVGEGSTDPAANAEVHRVSRPVLGDPRLRLMTVETAFVSVDPPGVPGGSSAAGASAPGASSSCRTCCSPAAVLERVWAQGLATARDTPTSTSAAPR